MTEGRNPFRKIFRSFSGETPVVDPEEKIEDIAPPNREIREAKFQIGQVVRHRMFPFRGVIFDVDPTYSNSEDWYNSIPEEVRPHRDQPYYHLFAENEKTHYIAYVSEQNLLIDDNPDPVEHPEITDFFDFRNGEYELKQHISN
ncbi:MAG: heat shock protein HspQ [Pseudomonadota bacterium]